MPPIPFLDFIPNVTGIAELTGEQATIISPLAYLTVGPLVDYVFEPLMRAEGPLAGTIVGQVLGTGPGRGIGLMYIVAGVAVITISGLAYMYPRIRHLEKEVPDAIA